MNVLNCRSNRRILRYEWADVYSQGVAAGRSAFGLPETPVVSGVQSKGVTGSPSANLGVLLISWSTLVSIDHICVCPPSKAGQGFLRPASLKFESCGLPPSNVGSGNNVRFLSCSWNSAAGRVEVQVGV